MWGGIDQGPAWGGFSHRSQCDALPAGFRDGCYWRFDWFGYDADAKDLWPSVSFAEVSCPQQLIDRTGCWRVTG